MSRFHAVTKYGACGRCPEITWHNGAECPTPPQPRDDHPVPCARCRRSTWNLDAICDSCALPAARVAAGDDGSAAVVPSFSPAGASRTASHQPPVGDHP